MKLNSKFIPDWLKLICLFVYSQLYNRLSIYIDIERFYNFFSTTNFRNCIKWFYNYFLPTIFRNCIQRLHTPFSVAVERLRNFELIRKPSGLVNRNENCYMNSLIQSLASSDKLIKQFKELQKIDGDHQLLDLFVEILDSVNKFDSKAKENSDKLMKFVKLMNWEKKLQQDPFDFLCSILKKIQLEIKNKQSNQCPLKIKVLYKITGIQLPNKTQDHLGLSLGLCGNYSEIPGVLIEDLIKEHFSPIAIDEDNNKTSQLFIYEKLPEVLLIHIQANKWNVGLQKMIKPVYHIVYKNCLNINFNVLSSSHEVQEMNCSYNLQAVIHHMGEVSFGHYITYRTFEDKWYLANDTQIEEKEFNCDVCPYILVYVSNEILTENFMTETNEKRS